MPRTGQIIPRYNVPHVSTYINNNTEQMPAVPVDEVENKVRFLCVFASSRGEDGVVKSLTNTTEFINEFGQPDFKKFGQPNLMPYTLLATNSARCHCLRVAAPNAGYATATLVAAVKVTTDENSVKFVDVKFENAELSTDAVISTKEYDEITDLAEALKSAEADAEGYFRYPLFTVISKGKGEYGNTFSFKLVSDISSNKAVGNSFINYNFELHDSSTGTDAVIEQFSGSLNPTAVLSRKSLLLDDVIGDPTSGSKYVEFIAHYDAIDEFITKCNALINDEVGLADTKLTINTFDFIHGLTKAGAPLTNAEGKTVYRIDTTGVVLDHKTDTVFLTKGDDGSFKNDDGTEINKALVEAFTKKAEIRSRRRTPTDIILDANYAQEVKAALVDCALARGDALLVLDSGIDKKTVAETIEWWSKFKLNNAVADSINDYRILRESQAYKTRDPFTGKIITVSMTYLFAQLLPGHFLNVGRHIPFVGASYATLINHIKSSIYPIVDADDLETKDELYNERINFFETIAEDTFSRATQVTSDPIWSDLSESNNVAVLLDMKRMLEDFNTRRLYNFASAEDRVKFTEDADRLFVNYKNREVSDYEVYFDMNEFEENRNILHCYLAVVFRALGKRCIVEIDINRRNTTV